MNNVFVLTTGRTGSKTLAAAMQHLPDPWTVGHETNIHTHINRLAYPDHHVEVDNRLAWMLGPLHDRYPLARYIWLRRDPEAVAQSYARRTRVRGGIVRAFDSGILLGDPTPNTGCCNDRWLARARLMVDTVEANIGHFLKTKAVERPDRVLAAVWIDRQPKADLTRAWNHLVDCDPPQAALDEFDTVRDRTS